nr:hypothetical protein [Entomoplasma sp. MP1]
MVKTVEKFLNYIMQTNPKQQYRSEQLWVPATKSGWKFYEAYLDGTYNNTTNEKQEEQLRNKEIEKDYYGNEAIDDEAAKAKSSIISNKF